MQQPISIKKVHSQNIDRTFLKYDTYFDSKSSLNIDNITINFLGLDEPNYGRLILKIQILENNIDITSKICNDGYCSPIEIDFISFENQLIYFPFDNRIVFYKIRTKEVINILFPNQLKGMKYIYKADNFIVVLFRNGYININLQNLKMSFSIIENINFITYVNGNPIVFINNFTEILLNSRQIPSAINISELYDSSLSKYVEKSYIESQKGFLWNNGFVNIENEKILPENTWQIMNYNDTTKIITIGTLIILDKGTFDESQRTMWFKTKNEYIEIRLTKHFS